MSETALLKRLIAEVTRTNELLEEIRDFLGTIDMHVGTLHDIDRKLRDMQSRLASIETAQIRISGNPDAL